MVDPKFKLILIRGQKARLFLRTNVKFIYFIEWPSFLYFYGMVLPKICDHRQKTLSSLALPTLHCIEILLTKYGMGWDGMKGGRMIPDLVVVAEGSL